MRIHSSNCAGADKHIIVEEEGEGGILPSANTAGEVAGSFAEAMGLDRRESIDEELNVTNAPNESVSGSVGVTAIGVREYQRSRNSGGPASEGATETLEEPIAPVKKQPKVSLAACIGSAPVVPSLLKILTTSRALFVKKGAAFKEVGFQVRKMAKETSRMLEEEGDRGEKDAILLAKVSGLDEGIAVVMQVFSDGVELIARTTDAVDDVIRDAFEMKYFLVARLLRDFFVLYRHHPR